jgi:intracellular multiplication protein IcmT
MKTVRFFNFDGRAGLMLVLVIVHMRTYTLVALISVMVIFYMLERKGLSFPAALRALRVWIIGPVRPGWIWTRRRGLVDTGSR